MCLHSSKNCQSAKIVFFCKVFTTSTNSSIAHHGEGVVEALEGGGEGEGHVEGKLLYNKREIPASPT